jgi:hypothetical protein
MPPRAAQRQTKSIRESEGAAALPAEVRQQLLDAIYASRAFRSVLRGLNLTPNQVWGMARVDGSGRQGLSWLMCRMRRVGLLVNSVRPPALSNLFSVAPTGRQSPELLEVLRIWMPTRDRKKRNSIKSSKLIGSLANVA